jgi:hypothetical protein
MSRSSNSISGPFSRLVLFLFKVCPLILLGALFVHHAAYVEACRAPSPKKEYNWSHPAVYFAGRATDWFFIANEPEEKTFPVFKRNYDLLLQRVQAGEKLEIDLPPALTNGVETPLSRDEQKARLKGLMGKL